MSSYGSQEITPPAFHSAISFLKKSSSSAVKSLKDSSLPASRMKFKNILDLILYVLFIPGAILLGLYIFK